MKKVIAFVLTVLVIFAFAACTPKTVEQSQAQTSEAAPVSSQAAQTESQTSAEPTEKLKIGFSILCTDGYYIKKYISRYEELIAERGYDSVMLDCQFDTATQATQMDNLIAQGVDIIFLMPNDPLAIVSSMKKANEAGIPIIVVHQRADASGDQYSLGFAGADTVAMGTGAGALMEEALGGTGNVVIIGGSPGSAYATDLTTGFMSQLSGTVTILDTGDAVWDRSNATTLMENYLTRYDDLDGVWAMDDNMAIGAINAIQTQGREGIAVVGINAQAEAYDYIRSGALYGTVKQDASGNVDAAFAVLDLYLAGSDIPPNTYSESPKVTKDNMDQIEPAF
jgi:ribose transport system substrate-binding protein